MTRVEHWKSIVGFDKSRRYKVSNRGRVHVLVCRAFHGEQPTPKHEANHKDLNKHNNCDWNLEWLTRKENVKHFYANGYTYGRRSGEANPAAKLSDRAVVRIRASYQEVRGQQ